MEKTSISTPTSSSARMSRSKNVATRAGYLLVKTASLTRSPREPVLAQPQFEREDLEHPLVQPSPTDGAATGPGPRVAELAQHDLTAAAVRFEVVRQREPQRHQPLVEHGHAHLDARPHAHHVHLAQHV